MTGGFRYVQVVMTIGANTVYTDLRVKGIVSRYNPRPVAAYTEIID